MWRNIFSCNFANCVWYYSKYIKLNYFHMKKKPWYRNFVKIALSVLNFEVGTNFKINITIVLPYVYLIWFIFKITYGILNTFFRNILFGLLIFEQKTRFRVNLTFVYICYTNIRIFNEYMNSKNIQQHTELRIYNTYC